MRIMGLDYGNKTVGVAITDDLLITAQAKETIFREHPTKLRKTLARIEALCVEYEVTSIVLGMPLHMNGDVGVRAEASEEFKEKLERRTGLPVILYDERLTTMEADEILQEMGVPKGERKQYIDKIAAQIILQDYLNNTKGNK